LEIERESLRARQVRARDLLRGDLEGRDLDEYVEQRLLTTTLESALNWGRANALFPLTFGLACCAIEMMSMVTSRYDIARFGAEAFRASPRQADMIILSGRVSIKMAPVVRRVYDQMLEPKWVIAMGACASSAGMFNNYATLQGVDKIVAVDVYVPGCPPRPEALMEGIIRLHERVLAGIPPAYEVREVAS
jgi:NADH-quinone oxidoreductase subunit B